MLLSQISSSNRLTRIVLNILIEYAPLLGLMQFYTHPGNSDNPRKKSAAGGGKYRSMNADYADNEVDPAFASLILAILGDVVQTDQAHERRGFDMASVRASDLRAFAEDLATFIMTELINGSGQSESPPALNGLLGMLPMSDGQAIYASGDNATAFQVREGSSETAVAAQQKLKRILHTLIRMIDGGPSAIMVSNDMMAFITSVFEASIDRTEDEFGNLITMFNGVPLMAPGYKASGGDVMPLDENPGSITENTQSILTAKFGEKRDLAAATNVGLSVTDNGLVGSHMEYNVEMDMQIGRLNDRSIARASGILLE